MPFLGQRPQRLREHFELLHLQRRLACFREETTALDADEIAQIEQPENLHRFHPEFLGLHVNLDPARRVAQIEEMTFPMSRCAVMRPAARSVALSAN